MCFKYGTKMHVHVYAIIISYAFSCLNRKLVHIIISTLRAHVLNMFQLISVSNKLSLSIK